ncbi:hypothetical protein BN1195_01605 [Chryseobacterium oranimense G311]|nr:hypothetical protein BN1195_01605 [Chryseobacterium oranimense G311]
MRIISDKEVFRIEKNYKPRKLLKWLNFRLEIFNYCY